MARCAFEQRRALIIGVLPTIVAVQLMTPGLLAEPIVRSRRDREPDPFVERGEE